MCAAIALTWIAMPAWAQFETRATSIMPQQGAFSIAGGDFNHDGFFDVVIIDDNGFTVSLGKGDGRSGIPYINCMLAQRGRCLCFRSVLNQPLGNKVLDKSKGRSNICAAPLLCELSKAEKPWQPTKDGAGGIAVRFHPSRVAINLRAEPTVTDSVDG
jgi:hypothetical protein